MLLDFQDVFLFVLHVLIHTLSCQLAYCVNNNYSFITDDKYRTPLLLYLIYPKRGVTLRYCQRRHAHSKFWLLSQVDFECSFQKTKNSRLIFSIFNTITQAWLDRSVRLSSAAKFKSAFAGWRWARYRRVFTALRIITNHTRCCWAYECNDQSEVFRWVIAKMPVFSSLGRWLNTSFWRILSSETTKCKCVYEYVSKRFIS